MTIPSTQLGGSASSVHVAKVAHGLMLMTSKNPVVPDEQAFTAIKAGLDLVAPGEKIFLNSGEFYGIEPRTANLELIGRFFAKYPQYVERAFLSVKGGSARDSLMPDHNPENLRASVETCIRCLGPFKRIDLFECARVDPNYPVEDTMAVLKGFVKEGLFDHIGVSEVSSDTLRRAFSIHPIAAVEIEISPWSYEEETKKVIVAAKELGVAVLAYSPLGRGFLTGTITKANLDPSDFRNRLPRFQDEAYEANKTFLDALTVISMGKGITNAQLCIAWVASLGDHVIPLPGSSAEKRTLENFSAASVKLDAGELKGIHDAIETLEVVGSRYPAGMHTWG